MNKKQKEQLKSWGVDPKALESRKEGNAWVSITLLLMAGIMCGAFLFALFIFYGGTDAFITDGHCEEMINTSSTYAASYGMEYAVAAITQEAIQCNQIPMNYSNYSYTLIAAECLNLNNQEVNQNG